MAKMSIKSIEALKEIKVSIKEATVTAVKAEKEEATIIAKNFEEFGVEFSANEIAEIEAEIQKPHLERIAGLKATEKAAKEVAKEEARIAAEKEAERRTSRKEAAKEAQKKGFKAAEAAKRSSTLDVLDQIMLTAKAENAIAESYDDLAKIAEEEAAEKAREAAEKVALAPLKFSGAPSMARTKNNKLYEEILMAKEIAIVGIDEKGQIITNEKVVSVANSLFNRTMMKLVGIAKDGVVLEMLDDEREVAYTVVTGKRYKLINGMIKVVMEKSFLNDKDIDESIKDDIKEAIKTGCLLYDEETKCLEIGNSERPEAKKMFITATWSPSSLKGHATTMYDFGGETKEKNEAFAASFHDVLSKSGISKELGRVTNFKKAETRIVSFDSVNGVKIDHPLYSEEIVTDKDGKTKHSITHGGILFLREPLKSVSEIIESDEYKNALEQAGIEAKINAADGQMIISSAWTAKAGNQMAGKVIYTEKNARGVNLQLRTDFCFNKAFALSMAKRSVKNVAKILMATHSTEDWFVLGNPEHINAICDGDCVKLMSFDDLKAGKIAPESINAVILDVAHTSVGLNNSSQAYNKVCNSEMRSFVDTALVNKVVKMADELVDDAKEKASKFDVPVIHVNDNLAQLARSVNKNMFNSTLVRKDDLKRLDSMKSRIANKAAVALDGFYEHVTFDSINAITGGIVKNLLGQNEKGEIEFYSRFASKDVDKYGRGILIKYPSQGTEESPRVALVSSKELMRRARKQVAAANLSKDHANIIMEIVHDFIDAIGDGTVLLPAINLMKEWVAGMDCDYDAVCIITEPFFVDAIADKMAKDIIEGETLVGNACYISYLKDLNIDLSDISDHLAASIAATSMTEEQAAKTITEYFMKCKAEMEFGSVIGETVSKGDLATTLADEFLFDEKSGKINFYGMVVIPRLFVPIVAKDKVIKSETVEPGKVYESVFKDGVNKFNIRIGTHANDNQGVIRFYLVNVDTVNAFVKELKSLDIRYITRKSYKEMMADFTYLVRALGESAIDMVKKGSEVDLGARMSDIIEGNTKKLSSTIKGIDDDSSNIMEFIHWCVYGTPDKTEIREGVYTSNKFHIDLGNEDVIDFMDGKKNLPSLKSDELVFIDKVGVLKVKLLRALMDSIQKFGNTIVAKRKENSANDFDWTSLVTSKYKNVLRKIDAKNPNGAAKALRKPLYNVSNALKAATDALYSRSLNKDLKSAIRDAIIAEFRCFSEVLDLQDVVALTIVAAFNYYYRAVHGNVNSMIKELNVKASDIKDVKRWDKATELVFKIFGPLTALVFLENKESLNVVIPVDRVYGDLSETEKLMINNIENVDFEELDDSGIYRLFLKESGKAFGTFEMPKELKGLVKGITDIGYAYSEEKNCKVLYAKVTPSWSDFRNDYKIVVLDKVMDEKGRNMCIASDFKNTSGALANFNYVPDMEYVKEVFEGRNGNLVYTMNEKADFSNYKFIGKQVVKRNYHLGSSMLKENEPVGGKYTIYVEDGNLSFPIGNHFCYEDISGKVEIAFKNVLIVK